MMSRLRSISLLVGYYMCGDLHAVVYKCEGDSGQCSRIAQCFQAMERCDDGRPDPVLSQMLSDIGGSTLPLVIRPMPLTAGRICKGRVGSEMCPILRPEEGEGETYCGDSGRECLDREPINPFNSPTCEWVVLLESRNDDFGGFCETLIHELQHVRGSIKGTLQGSPTCPMAPGDEDSLAMQNRWNRICLGRAPTCYYGTCKIPAKDCHDVPDSCCPPGEPCVVFSVGGTLMAGQNPLFPIDYVIIPTAKVNVNLATSAVNPWTGGVHVAYSGAGFQSTGTVDVSLSGPGFYAASQWGGSDDVVSWVTGPPGTNVQYCVKRVYSADLSCDGGPDIREGGVSAKALDFAYVGCTSLPEQRSLAMSFAPITRYHEATIGVVNPQQSVEGFSALFVEGRHLAGGAGVSTTSYATSISGTVKFRDSLTATIGPCPADIPPCGPEFDPNFPCKE